MPLMKGLAPIRRTVKYLDSSKLVLKDRIRIFAVNYARYSDPAETPNDPHRGAREFVFWTIPQIQYKNPNVQVITFKNLTPTPFITCFLDDGSQVVVDLDSRSRPDIESHVKKVLCKTDEQLELIATAAQKIDNPANFGFECERNCICIIPGQVPCPGVVQLPYHMRGRYNFLGKFEEEVLKEDS